jgi:Mg-chelatase subunit ChlD
MIFTKIFSVAFALFLTYSALALAGGDETKTTYKLTIHNLNADRYPNNELLVTLRDQRGRAVRSLAEKDLSLEENGQKVAIELKPIVNGSLGLVILVDSSESVGGLGKSWKLQMAKETIAKILADLRPGDGATLVDFDEKPRLLVPFSRDRQAVQGALSQVTAGGGTSLHDAVLYGVHLAKRLPTKRQALVLITDGQEAHSKTTEAEALQAASRAKIPLIALDFSDEAEYYFLQALAYQTKGAYRHLTQTKENLASIFYSAHADAWKLMYASPYTERDGAMRSVQLTYAGSGTAFALAMREYQVPARDLVSCAPNFSDRSSLEIGSAEGSIGQIFRIPLTLRNSKMSLAGFDLTLQFDPTVIRVLALEAADSQSELSAIELDPAIGQIRLAGAWPALRTEPGIVLTYLNVEIIGQAGRRTDLIATSVQLTSAANEMMPVLSLRGSISVVGSRLGDVNGDGKTDVADAFRIASYVAGYIHALALDLGVADTNRDGAITMDDAWAIIFDRVGR